LLPVVRTGQLSFVEEDRKLPATSEIAVLFLNTSNYLSDLPQPVVTSRVADEKFEIE
jgi:hypothetical protein